MYELALLSFVQTKSYLAEIAPCLFLQHALHVQVACPIADGRGSQILAQITVSFQRLNDLHLCTNTNCHHHKNMRLLFGIWHVDSLPS